MVAGTMPAVDWADAAGRRLASSIKQEAALELQQLCQKTLQSRWEAQLERTIKEAPWTLAELREASYELDALVSHNAAVLAKMQKVGDRMPGQTLEALKARHNEWRSH